MATGDERRTSALTIALRIIAVWSAVAVVLTQQAFLARQAAGAPMSWLQLFVQNFPGAMLWAALTPLAGLAVRRFPVGGSHTIRHLAVHVVLLHLFGLADTLFMLLQAIVLGEPHPGLPMMYLRFYGWNLTTYLMLVAVYHAITASGESRRERVARAEVAAQLAEARLRGLASQLRPHFLFNALNLIAEQLHQSPATAERSLLRLGALLRASLERDASQEVPLAEELETMQHYLDIAAARFADRMTVRVDVDPATHSLLVPALVLQPLVENAVQHGVEPRQSSTSIEVSARIEGGRLQLAVRDDGAGLPAGQVREGIGLTNTRERLYHLYGNNASLTVQVRTGGGTESRLELPVRRQS